MKAKQFAWMYLLSEGNANMKPSFYGGYEKVRNAEPDPTLPGGYSWRKHYEKTFMAEIEKHGIDWDRTDAPETEKHSQFTDTFHDPEYKDFLVGTLYLKNGIEQEWIAEPRVSDVFAMMADADRYKEMFAKFEGLV